jgi:hypothetical protein
MFFVASRSPPTHSDEVIIPNVTIHRYQIAKNQGFSFWASVDIVTGEDLVHQKLQVIPTTFSVVTHHKSPMDEGPMGFYVTFRNNACMVSRVLPAELDHIDLNYNITLVNKQFFFFDNADPKELRKLELETDVNCHVESAEAFKVGIFMLALGRIGHEKIQQATVDALAEQGHEQEARYIKDGGRATQQISAGMATIGVRDSELVSSLNALRTAIYDAEVSNEEGNNDTIASVGVSSSSGATSTSMVDDTEPRDGEESVCMMGFSSGGAANTIVPQVDGEDLIDLDGDDDTAAVATIPVPLPAPAPRGQVEDGTFT